MLARATAELAYSISYFRHLQMHLVNAGSRVNDLELR